VGSPFLPPEYTRRSIILLVSFKKQNVRWIRLLEQKGIPVPGVMADGIIFWWEELTPPMMGHDLLTSEPLLVGIFIERECLVFRSGAPGISGPRGYHPYLHYFKSP